MLKSEWLAAIQREIHSHDFSTTLMTHRLSPRSERSAKDTVRQGDKCGRKWTVTGNCFGDCERNGDVTPITLAA
jgi:hypothetical protein